MSMMEDFCDRHQQHVCWGGYCWDCYREREIGNWVD